MSPDEITLIWILPQNPTSFETLHSLRAMSKWRMANQPTQEIIICNEYEFPSWLTSWALYRNVRFMHPDQPISSSVEERAEIKVATALNTVSTKYALILNQNQIVLSPPPDLEVLHFLAHNLIDPVVQKSTSYIQSTAARAFAATGKTWDHESKAYSFATSCPWLVEVEVAKKMYAEFGYAIHGPTLYGNLYGPAVPRLVKDLDQGENIFLLNCNDVATVRQVQAKSTSWLPVLKKVTIVNYESIYTTAVIWPDLDEAISHILGDA